MSIIVQVHVYVVFTNGYENKFKAPKKNKQNTKTVVKCSIIYITVKIIHGVINAYFLLLMKSS